MGHTLKKFVFECARCGSDFSATAEEIDSAGKNLSATCQKCGVTQAIEMEEGFSLLQS